MTTNCREEAYAELDTLMRQGWEFESTFDGWRAYRQGDTYYEDPLWAPTLSQLVANAITTVV